MDRSSVLAALFRSLDEEGINYCVLDGVGGLSAPVSLIVPDALLARMLPALLHRFCSSMELDFVDYRQEGPSTWRCALSWRDGEERPAFLTLLARSDYVRNGRQIFSAAELLSNRVPVVTGAENTLAYFAASPSSAFVCSLLQHLDRGELGDAAAAHLSEQWRRDPDGCAVQLQRFFDPAREGGIVARAAQSGGWSPVKLAMQELQEALRQRLPLTFRARWHRLQQTWRNWRTPRGMLVACLGPDGSGKTSLMEALGREPPVLFEQVDTMHLRPGLLRQSGTLLKPRSVQEKPRGRVATLLKLLMFVADYWLGYWFSIRPKLVRSILLISHRYYDDVLVDPRRYRIAGTRWLVRMLRPVIPRPGLWLVFDLPGEALQTRNQDVSEEEATRQRRAYRRARRRRESSAILDARQPLPKVIAQAERAIVAHVAQCTAERLGLPKEELQNPASTQLLLFFCRHHIPVLSRLVRIVFNSDIYCLLPEDIHLPHPYGVVIHSQAIIGRRVTIMQQVTIGGKDQSESIAPVIGNDVYIGAGVRVLGDVRIGDGVVIGANAVVTHDIPPGVTVVGNNRIIGEARSPERLSSLRSATIAELRQRVQDRSG